MENSIDCKIGDFQTEGNVIMLHKHLDKSVFVSFFLTHTTKRYSNHYTVCMFYCIGIYNKHCLSLPKLKNDNTQHTHPLKFFNLVIVHTLDFWYMIKNK